MEPECAAGLEPNVRSVHEVANAPGASAMVVVDDALALDFDSNLARVRMLLLPGEGVSLQGWAVSGTTRYDLAFPLVRRSSVSLFCQWFTFWFR